MGTKVGRIVKDFIFRGIIDTRTPIEITFHRHRLLCRLLDATDESLELEILDGDPASLERGEPLHVFLHFQNNHHTFDATCLGLVAQPTGAPRLLVSHPEGLYKNLQRKHERVRVPEGMEIYFMLQGRRVDLGFPKTQKLPPIQHTPEPPPESPPLDALVKSFRAEASAMFSTNRIVMYRERAPSTPEEAIAAALGSILWIASIDEGIPEAEPLPGVPVITLPELRAYEASIGTPEDLVEIKISRLLVAKRARGVFAEATCPILHGEYVLGCVAVANLLPRRERIGEEQLTHIWQFSQVLANALERSRYVAEGASDRRRYDAPVIDLSPSGLLFRHPSDELAMELLVNTDVRLNLTLAARSIDVLARIRRKFTEPGQVYYGVQFAEIAPEDHRFLFEHLYGRAPGEEDETRWEGGAPPPRVDLFGDQS